MDDVLGEIEDLVAEEVRPARETAGTAQCAQA